MSKSVPVSVAYGDGIGPEIMEATLAILDAAGAPIAPEKIDVGEQVYLQGHSSGITDEAWDSLERTRILFKAPITTPQGGGYKSLNVTIRKSLGLYSNVRPCRALSPYVPTNFPHLDMIIVRENEEDLYAGIEYRQTQETVQSLKLYTRSGCERIIRFAFEYAKQYGRKKISCLSKDNIMKMTDGLFHKVFDEVAKEYPGIKTDHYIVDIGTALLATQPERFDVVVTSNLYGDIVSDVVAELMGSVGLAGSANIGDNFAMFEAIHGSAPDIAGKGLANPSGLINAAVMMMMHINEVEIACTLHNAWLKTIEEGIHTTDIYSMKHSKKHVSTKEFSDAVIERLGQAPENFPRREATQQQERKKITVTLPPPQKKQLIGIDVFLDMPESDLEALAEKLQSCHPELELKMIGARGSKLWPGRCPKSYSGDLLRCRFEHQTQTMTHKLCITLLEKVEAQGLEFVRTELLYTFDGELGFSLAQGQ